MSTTSLYSFAWRNTVAVLAKVRVHPLFVVLVIAAVGVGLWKSILVLFLLIILHELGHAVAANALGYEVESVSLLPFGGVAKLSYGSLGFIPRHEAMIAAAGPAVNLLLIGLAWVLYATTVWPEAFYRTVVEWNLWIAVFNLLPGLPLDGGRVLRAARSRRFGYEAATREAYLVSFVLSFMLFALGACALWMGYPHFGVLVLGVFLFVTAWTGRRDVSMDTIRFLDAKRKSSRSQPTLVRALMTPATVTFREVIRRFAPDRYHMIYVVGKNGEVKTILEEDEVLDAALSGEWLTTIDQWLNQH